MAKSWVEWRDWHSKLYVPESKVALLGMGDLPPLLGNPYNGYINPYYWVDDHPVLYGKQWEFRPQHISLHTTGGPKQPVK